MVFLIRVRNIYVYIHIHTYTHIHIYTHIGMCAQSCPTLCDPVDCSPPGSSVYGIIPTGTLEWVKALLPDSNILMDIWYKIQCVSYISYIMQKICVRFSRLVMCNSLQPHRLQPTRLPCPWISQARTLKCVAIPFSRGRFSRRVLTQGLNLSLLHCRQVLYHLSHQGSSM